MGCVSLYSLSFVPYFIWSADDYLDRKGPRWGRWIRNMWVLSFSASRPVCLAEARVRTAALLPSTSQSGDQSCSLGWAGGGGDPAGVWLRSNPGDYYHWAHRHASSGICCWRRPWLLWLPPHPPTRSEVIMHPAILHCETRISPVNSLLSLCVHCFLHGGTSNCCRDPGILWYRWLSYYSWQQVRGTLTLTTSDTKQRCPYYTHKENNSNVKLSIFWPAPLLWLPHVTVVMLVYVNVEWGPAGARVSVKEIICLSTAAVRDSSARCRAHSCQIISVRCQSLRR